MVQSHYFLMKEKQAKVYDNALEQNNTEPPILTSLERTCIKLNTNIYLDVLEEEPETLSMWIPSLLWRAKWSQFKSNDPDSNDN